ncbi:acyltransferase 3 [Gracilibacillus halophilus YIM-C55.5]|uniref:Acyltransferase 3 n=1 Tax=Gracilibacillus halophilus YIM-C55.5 TaxID=1308866 RepID=N4WPQ9_9BACI|nr:acyltransferase family protein [Gracilibacillus halophilus]ENH98077.1 acyltransferase 3 [Gracilibacillus halophilus YIM-C55.5]
MNDLRIPDKRFRPEIEGIRALAALLVAIYHIWINSVSGGVDVFFIVSGYLITTSLVSKITRDGTIRFFDYLFGLFRRLLPLALIVIFFTTVMSIYLLPKSRWGETIPEIFASIFYYQNWQLANNAIDYLAQNNSASPLQHFWALSLQGQFYITWPLLILIVFFVSKRLLKTPIRKTLLVSLSFVFIISLGYSMYITSNNQSWAYFDSFARVWEFSLGGILALVIPYLKFNRMVHLIIGWMGVAVISLTGVMIPVSNTFPGFAALIPTTAVILVLVSAENNHKFSVHHLLGTRPFLFFGSISYAFYLWHWPILIFYYTHFNVDSVPFVDGLYIILIAFVLSFISSRIIESPIRKVSVQTAKLRLTTILLLFLIPVIAMSTAWNMYFTQSTTASTTEDSIKTVSTRLAKNSDTTSSNNELIPSLLKAPEDLSKVYDRSECYTKMTETEVKTCSVGETENPSYTIALIGGSHSGHWYTPLMEIAKNLNLQIDLYIKDACRFSTKDFDGVLSESCMTWNQNVVEPLIESNPDLVFTTASVSKGETIPQGYLEMWEKLEGNTHVFAVRDNPYMPEDIPQCIEEKGIEECSTDRDKVLADTKPWENTEDVPNNVTFADLSDYYCDDDTCYPVLNNIIVYRDSHHFSATFAKTLAPPLQEHIEITLDKIDTKNSLDS